jgi:hypothetical protein
MLLYLLLHMRAMHDPAHRFSLLAAVSCGLPERCVAPLEPKRISALALLQRPVVWNLLQRLGFALDLLAIRLSAFVLPLRLTAIRTAILRKLAFIGLVSAQAAAVGSRRRPYARTLPRSALAVARSW